MSERIFVIVGNWGFAPAPKGITIYEYSPENGDLKLIETTRPDIAAGQLYLDQQRGIVYVCDECGERRGEIGGGGYVLAFQIDSVTGKLELINERESLCPEPSFVCMDKYRKYLLVCHCADPWHVTKVVRGEDGVFLNQVLFDDAGLVMFAIKEDGSIGRVCDISVTPGTGGKGADSEVNIDPVSGHMQLVQVLSRQHCVVPSPDGGLYVVCDKGMDCIYTYRIDYEKEKLIQLDCFPVSPKTFPRYVSFHPTLPIFYVNNEIEAAVYVFTYEKNSGKMELRSQVPLLFQEVGYMEGKPVGAQDILTAPDGNTLYCSLVGVHSISVLKLDAEGTPVLVQVIPCGGRMPRGIQISPDRKFLLSGNMLSHDITVFGILEDGTLYDTGKKFDAVSPSALRFFKPVNHENRAGMEDQGCSDVSER